MQQFDKLYLSWRQGKGSRRHIVGLLERKPDSGFSFSYDTEVVEQARKEGFSPYTEFPDITKTYNGTVLDVFAQRLMKQERPDIQDFYDFWEIEPQYTNDKFYLLGHTQGLLPTDNFEFLADYQVVDGLHFLTELAGLSKYQLQPGSLKPGDSLRFELDPTNEYDGEAAKIYKDALEIGYVKKIHCRLFRKEGASKLKLFVKAVEQNGKINRVFIKVAL